MGDVLQNISNVIANLGTALLENMKAEQDMRFVQSFESPDCKMYAKEQLASQLAETWDKRRYIELSRSSIAEQQQENEWQTTENEEHIWA